MKNLGKYISESRFNFTGGYCTAYLMRREGPARGYYIHTITRMDGGCYFTSTPFEVSPDVAESKMKFTATLMPMG